LIRSLERRPHLVVSQLLLEVDVRCIRAAERCIRGGKGAGLPGYRLGRPTPTELD
jgi:hypothetical protein